MAAGDKTPGVARPELAEKPYHLKPGEYTVCDVDGRRVAFVCVPTGQHGRLEGWELTEHDDGTITVSPSIDAHESATLGDNGERVAQPRWHGFLERGVFREV